jgi:hypothetical protein
MQQGVQHARAHRSALLHSRVSRNFHFLAPRPPGAQAGPLHAQLAVAEKHLAGLRILRPSAVLELPLSRGHLRIVEAFPMPAAENQAGEIYDFGPFRIDPEKQILLRDGEPVALTPKAFQLLLVIVRRGNQVVSKDELMKAVWPDTFVKETNLTRNIFTLRKALGETELRRGRSIKAEGTEKRHARGNESFHGRALPSSWNASSRVSRRMSVTGETFRRPGGQPGSNGGSQANRNLDEETELARVSPDRYRQSSRACASRSLTTASKPAPFLMKISLNWRSWRRRIACSRTNSSSARNMAISARSV